TSDRYESFSPAFSADGRWLYFLSNRHFEATPGAPWGDRNMGPMFDRRTRIYALALQPGNRFPFQPVDELVPAGAGKDGDAKKNGDGGKDARDAKALPPIVFDGLAERLYEVPLPPGNYARLQADAERLYFLDTAAGSEAKPQLR